MILSHLFFQIYISLFESDDCIALKYDELLEYINSAHTEVEDLSSRWVNGSNECDRYKTIEDL